MSPRGLACVLVACALAAQGVRAADSAGKRLERIRAEIEEREARAAKLADEAEGYLGELEGIDRQLSVTRGSIGQLRKRQSEARDELQVAETELENAEGQLARGRIDVNRRLVALYKFRATGGFPALYSAADFQAIARKGRGLGRVLASDAKLFDRFQASLDEWTSARDERAGLVSELASARREVDQREDSVRRKLIERKNLVALLRSRAGRERKAADELRDAARRLEEKLRALPTGEPALPGPKGSGLSKGRVAWPVEGPVRLGYGRQVDPEFGTETLRTGIEIDAQRGTPVRAVGAGRVLFAGWFRGYGQMVIVDHGRATVSVSGYLEDLATAADQYVESGQTLGSVGSGALSGPGLYFEIRRDGKPVDPQVWLE